jgi:hypothetical protein
MAIKKAEKAAGAKQKATKGDASALPKAAKKTADASKPRLAAPSKPAGKKRGPGKASVPAFEDFRKMQGELEATKKKAMADMRKSIDAALGEADGLKKQYAELFGEKFDSSPKAGSPKVAKAKTKAKAKTAKVASSRAISKEQVEAFLEQKSQGIDVKSIKVKGKNAIGVEKINAAYDKAETKDAQSILALL